METVTSATVVRVLKGIIGRFSWVLSYSLRNGNGIQFVSDAFQIFVRDNVIEHRRIIPLAP